MFSKETREGWPLLTVKKLRGMGTQRVQMKGILPWLVHLACRAISRNFSSFPLKKERFSDFRFSSIDSSLVAERKMAERDGWVRKSVFSS